jgi:hypothetical protein
MANRIYYIVEEPGESPELVFKYLSDHSHYTSIESAREAVIRAGNRPEMAAIFRVVEASLREGNKFTFTTTVEEVVDNRE